MTENRIALFELTTEGDLTKVVEERHYKLIPGKDLDKKAIINYR